ncbi:hypothetical protein KAR91_50655 [Candidatus Pacearchaeota archaeon]|nr:hypothetical protein [Candidatus Pacearchaeota archaeon]
MGKPKTIKIDEVKYVRADSVSPQEIKGDIKIVVLQRGWAMVGRFERSGSDCKLHNSACIRRWGTTKGLGEIAAGGPTSKTVLDKNCGLVTFDYLTVVCTIDCEESKWASVL